MFRRVCPSNIVIVCVLRFSQLKKVVTFHVCKLENAMCVLSVVLSYM